MTEPRYPTLQLEVSPVDADAISSALFDLGALGVEERDATTLDKSSAEGRTLLVAHFEDRDRATIAGEALGLPFSVVDIVGDEWKSKWREFFKPSRVGRRFIVRPPWETIEPAADDHVLTIDPGQAFGTGTHETTRLVLAELEDLVRAEHRVLDVGCGSGILSIGALLLGARSALGVDIDDESMQASAENAALNGVAARIRATKEPLHAIDGRFDVVLANIESRVLVPLADEIASRVAAEGSLLLSGLLAHEEDELRETYSPLGLEHVRTTREKDWIAMLWRRPAPKKASAKKASAKKTSTKKASAKKASAKKASAKKASAKKASAKKASAKKASAKKASTKKASTKKASTKKASAKKASAKKASTKKAR